MKKIILLSVFGMCFIFGNFANAENYLSSSDSSAGRKFGLGIFLGSPSALTGNYWLDKTASVDGGLAFAFDDYFLLYGDYLYHFPGGFGHRDKFVSELDPYVGVGGLVAVTNKDSTSNDHFRGKNKSTFGAAVRVPLGIEWMAPKPALGVYVELAPGLSVTPETSAFVQGGVGVRYYFE